MLSNRKISETLVFHLLFSICRRQALKGVKVHEI
nr:MAG TPA: hypothetical protein [Microviridae sp.]